MCEKHWLVASPTPPSGDPARNPGMCPNWESNWRPYGSQAGTQSIEPHQPGLPFLTFTKTLQWDLKLSQVVFTHLPPGHEKGCWLASLFGERGTWGLSTGLLNELSTLLRHSVKPQTLRPEVNM